MDPYWDQVIAPALRRIESSSVICRERAKHVESEVNYLTGRPEWLTRAKDEMDAAKKALEDALKRINKALELYEKVPLEDKK